MGGHQNKNKTRRSPVTHQLLREHEPHLYKRRVMVSLTQPAVPKFND